MIFYHKVFHISYAYITQSTHCGNKDPIIMKGSCPFHYHIFTASVATHVILKEKCSTYRQHSATAVWGMLNNSETAPEKKID